MKKTIAKSEARKSGHDLSIFLEISSFLTGYSQTDLEGTGMLAEYFAILMKEEDHRTIRSFLIRAEEVMDHQDGIDEAIKSAFIDLPDTAKHPDPSFDEMNYAGLATRIILLWYTGIWTTMNGMSTQSQQQRTAMVSAQSYQQGLIWATAGTHPSGAKQPGFGSWSRPPL